jgi:signal transduction histidine kinase
MDRPESPSLLERYQRLVDNTKDLATTLDLEILLNQIMQAAADLSDSEAASILLYDENSKLLHFEAATNLDEPMMRGLTVPVESSIAGWIVTNRLPKIVNNTETDPRHFGKVGSITQVSTQSLLGVPLITKDKVIGVLEVINKRTGSFDEEDQDLMVALGAQAAVAIENSRLFQQSDLISELIHELRTPLASISTSAHLLLRPEVSEEQRRRMVEIIHDETFRLSEMTSSFLDLARLESGRAQFQTETFNPKDLLEESAAVMLSRITGKGLRFSKDLEPRLPSIKADRNKIKQVLLNLLSNAIKYNRVNGSIKLNARSNDDELIIEVCDTGLGILPENLSHLFEKFYRAPGVEYQVSGTGLGLAISKRIVDAHRGRIEVESHVGKGTTFTVTLPIN